VNVARKQDGYVGLLAIAFNAATVLLVLCPAAEDELNAAWDGAQPILSSVVL